MAHTTIHDLSVREQYYLAHSALRHSYHKYPEVIYEIWDTGTIVLDPNKRSHSYLMTIFEYVERDIFDATVRILASNLILDGDNILLAFEQGFYRRVTNYY